jgi:hypothetical protein
MVDAPVREDVEIMRFVLTFEGRLPSSGNAAEKHKIRQSFHPQLRRQWEIEPVLYHVGISTSNVDGILPADGRAGLDSPRRAGATDSSWRRYRQSDKNSI